MVSIHKKLSKKLIILTAEQEKLFYDYIPGKVYKTERNIAIIVASLQLFMIFVFLIGNQKAFNSVRGIQYFSLYVFLWVATVLAIILYRYTRSRDNQSAFLWIRRCYAVVLCIWVLCITLLEGMHGKGITVYCYLLPTMAAVLLLRPAESFILFGMTWLILIITFLLYGSGNVFSIVLNSSFVTLLTLFISFRYYRSMAVEFCDRETISTQYQKIELSNKLLQKMAQVDQLTNLFNRHYLLDNIYPLFNEFKEKQNYGAFFMLDIDYFKQYNDTYGHVQGDLYLKIIARVLEATCEKYKASAIRYGGEEFLLIKMGDKSILDDNLGQELVDKIHELNINRNDADRDRLTVSIGMWSGSLTNIQDIECAIKKADEALYQAKSNGRNQLVRSL